jgi:hypothetical protein
VRLLGRHLHRQVGRFLTLEDAIDVACGASVLVGDVLDSGVSAAISVDQR